MAKKAAVTIVPSSDDGFEDFRDFSEFTGAAFWPGKKDKVGAKLRGVYLGGRRSEKDGKRRGHLVLQDADGKKWQVGLNAFLAAACGEAGLKKKDTVEIRWSGMKDTSQPQPARVFEVTIL